MRVLSWRVSILINRAPSRIQTGNLGRDEKTPEGVGNSLLDRELIPLICDPTEKASPTRYLKVLLSFSLKMPSDLKYHLLFLLDEFLELKYTLKSQIFYGSNHTQKPVQMFTRSPELIQNFKPFIDITVSDCPNCFSFAMDKYSEL